ncbi:MAG TPA: helical backbone metal receptor [Nocardioidaceae bacterium]|nr:helical backbone metal receptor [Nocardioidaceae bacterium]
MSQRVVSLVPSLTEAIAVTCPGVLVGATDWCTHPADLVVTRLRGTKNPDLDGVRALRPDLVVVNREENRPDDIDALRTALGADRVWITDPETVPAALDQLRKLLGRLGARRIDWLDAAETEWRAPWTGDRRTALVPIWRRPWMALGRDTFAGDLLSRLGVDHCFASDAERYPRFDVESVPPVDLVVLPDEPYAFAADDGPEAFPGHRCALVSGRHLTWYGPSLAEAREILLRQLAGSAHEQ